MAKSKIKTKLEIIVLLLIVIAGLLALLLVNDAEKYKFVDSATYFVDGVEYEIPAGKFAKYDKETKTVYVDLDKDYKLYSKGLPAYYNNSKSMVLLNDMSIIIPSDNYLESNRLTYYTLLENDSDISGSKISRNNNFEFVNKGFLFDGNNTYVFLEPVLLRVKNDILKLGTFSYVIACKDNYFEIYDIDSKYFDIIYTNESLDAEIQGTNSNFLLYPEVDYVSVNGGNGMLLSSNVEGSELLK